MVSGASASEPARQDDLGTVLAVGRSMDSKCEDPASASECALRRHSSKVGAVCSNSARTDLCGGRLGNRRPYRDKRLQTASGARGHGKGPMIQNHLPNRNGKECLWACGPPKWMKTQCQP